MNAFRIGICTLLLLSAVGCKQKAERPHSEPSPESSLADTEGLLPTEEPVAISDSTAHYRYAVRFPRTGEPIVDTLIEQFVRVQIDSFVAQAPTSVGGREMHSELDMNYSSSTFPPHIACYKFDTYMFTGGAHGMTAITTLNFDMQTNHLLLLSDLFEQGSPYAESLSVICREELRDRLGEMLNEEMLAAGTSPEPANFARFMLAPRDLVVFFEPYAVAPYAAGAQVVSIPLHRLSSMLLPAFRPAAPGTADSLISHN